MKNIYFFILIMNIMFCWSCQNAWETDEGNHFSLEGTDWKLAGLVDAQTGVLKELEPKDCEK